MTVASLVGDPTPTSAPLSTRCRVTIPSNGATHRCVVQIDLGRLDGGFGVQHLRGGLIGFRLPFLHRRLAGEIAFTERCLALIFGLVVRERRLIGRESRIRLVELSLVLIALDAE